MCLFSSATDLTVLPLLVTLLLGFLFGRELLFSNKEVKDSTLAEELILFDGGALGDITEGGRPEITAGSAEVVFGRLLVFGVPLTLLKIPSIQHCYDVKN